jgi:hypothetical protein
VPIEGVGVGVATVVGGAVVGTRVATAVEGVDVVGRAVMSTMEEVAAIPWLSVTVRVTEYVPDPR